jgi:hypothetical protein
MKSADNNASPLTYFLEYTTTLSPSQRLGPPAHQASNVAVALEAQWYIKACFNN